MHEGEKRFACGETDLSTSKKVAGWDGYGCGKRYGTKLALEEHIRTAHLGFPNAKALRRQRLGQGQQNNNDNDNDTTTNTPSTLAALTGAGYEEETGRHIACFIDSCAHRFHRDYDLWVHMGGKHGCSEDEIRELFLRRALLSANEGRQQQEQQQQQQQHPSAEVFGIYGYEFDPDPYELYPAEAMDATQDTKEIPPDNDMALIDPVLTYNLMN